MLKGLSYKLINNCFKNFVSLKLLKNPILMPLFFTYYITLRCNFRCSYCDFAGGKKSDVTKELNTEDIIRLMSIIKRVGSHIYFTGGEPLLRSDIVTVFRSCRQIGFKSVAINTNMSLIHKKMDILDHITDLVASFDAFDVTKNAKILGVSKFTVEQTKDNIVACAKLQAKKNFVMTINCVVIPETIGIVKDVMDFCFQHKIRFAIVPAELTGGKINDSLKYNKEYRRLIKDIIKAKKQGHLIFNSDEYLNTIYDFKRFDCYPTLTPHIYPNGDLFYPCQPMLKLAANLLETDSYKDALANGIKRNGLLPMCKEKCYKACYIEPSSFTKNPLLGIKEFCSCKIK